MNYYIVFYISTFSFLTSSSFCLSQVINLSYFLTFFFQAVFLIGQNSRCYANNSFLIFFSCPGKRHCVLYCFTGARQMLAQFYRQEIKQLKGCRPWTFIGCKRQLKPIIIIHDESPSYCALSPRYLSIGHPWQILPTSPSLSFMTHASQSNQFYGLKWTGSSLGQHSEVHFMLLILDQT